MPSWHARLLAGSPTDKSTLDHSSSTQQATKIGSIDDLRLPRSMPHGSVQMSTASSSMRPQHSRSYSHPSGSVHEQKPNGETESGQRNGRFANIDPPIHSGTRVPADRKALEAPSNLANTAGAIERDLVTGRCATCSSLVRWPHRLSVFRCAGCLMINDLKPRAPCALDTTPERLSESRDNDCPATKQSRVTALSLSLVQTLRIVDSCIERYIVSQLPITPHRRTAQRPPHDDRSSSVEPVHPPPEPKATSFAAKEGDRNLTHKPSTIFSDLEDYIVQCFNDVNCLNSSFLTSRPARTARTASEGVVTRSGERRRSDGLVSMEVDAKTLLLGDFAENGTWWAGKSQPSQAFHHRAKDDRALNGDCIEYMSSPCISYTDVDKWYDVILSLSHLSRHKSREVWQQQSDSLKATQRLEYQEPVLALMHEELIQSSMQVQRTLLKATEGLLRRPGRPLKTPSDCRFLLIIMANPLISDSERTDPLALSSSARSSAHAITAQVVGVRTRLSKESPKPRVLISKHSSILKRIFGIISNLSPQCHRCFVNWFSQDTDSQLQKLVDMTGNFVSHRLLRAQSRRRPSNEDPIARGLVPEIREFGAGTSAQLHDAIGFGQKSRLSQPSGLGTSYGDDWQIKAAAKFMLLLFSANNSDQPKYENTHNRGSPMSSATSKHTRIRAHALPINAFYNVYLDYCDLVSDFEAWESRRAKFCFCQYPMFLSIWAKIGILEYDTRRQMEIKAREAFFNSIISRKAISQYLVLKVRRDCLVEDSLKTVSEIVGTGQEEIKKGLKIEFVGEDGLDSGGLRKEWFLLLVREIFDPEHGLFTYDGDSNFCYFNPHSFETSDQFFLVGVLLGLAIYNSTILDIALPPFAFRKLLASSPLHAGPSNFSTRRAYHCSLDDLAEYKPALANGLRKLLEYDGDVEETFALDFVANGERFGEPYCFPLCSNGDRRPVTNVNRREYVKLYVKHVLDDSVTRQFEPFKRGFFTVCGGNALSLFRSEEIELLVRGSDEPLDIATIKAVATYDGWGTCPGPTMELPVLWFWEAFTEASPRMQRRLLSFITASDRIPAVGATSLVIKIVCVGDDVRKFPIARTCFNMIGFPRYPSKQHLESKLWKAVAEGGGFGMK